MKNKKEYTAPALRRKVLLERETELLAGSVVENVTGVEATGQTFESMDFSSTSTTFNHTWGE